MKALTVIKVTREQLKDHGFPISILLRGELFIRCNQKGEVNWDKASVYTWAEIQKESQRRQVRFSSGPKEQWEL